MDQLQNNFKLVYQYTLHSKIVKTTFKKNDILSVGAKLLIGGSYLSIRNKIGIVENKKTYSSQTESYSISFRLLLLTSPKDSIVLQILGTKMNRLFANASVQTRQLSAYSRNLHPIDSSSR